MVVDDVCGWDIIVLFVIVFGKGLFKVFKVMSLDDIVCVC